MHSPASFASPLPALPRVPLPASVVACLRDAHAAHLLLARRAFEAVSPDAMDHLNRTAPIHVALLNAGLGDEARAMLRDAARCHSERPGGRFDPARVPAPRVTPQALAVAYAAQFDRIAALDHTSRAAALLDAAGELLGGLSAEGFVHDLDARMDAIEDELVAEHPEEVTLGRGTDPDAGRSAWLEELIAMRQEDAARAWLRDAQAIMAAPADPAAWLSLGFGELAQAQRVGAANCAGGSAGLACQQQVAA